MSNLGQSKFCGGRVSLVQLLGKMMEKGSVVILHQNLPLFNLIFFILTLKIGVCLHVPSIWKENVTVAL